MGERPKPPEIAIIDNDISFREALVGLVDSFGFSSVPFESAIEFIAFDRVPNFACIITDVQMPHMDGLELQRWLGVEGHRIALIFVTAVPSDEIRSKAMDAGAIGFFGKPFDQECLLLHLRTAIASNNEFRL